MNAVLNLLTRKITVQGVTVVTARETPRGWYWFSSATSRSGRKTNFPSAGAALRAGARTLGLTIAEVIE